MLFKGPLVNEAAKLIIINIMKNIITFRENPIIKKQMKNIVNSNLIALLSPSFLRVGLKSVNRIKSKIAIKLCLYVELV